MQSRRVILNHAVPIPGGRALALTGLLALIMTFGAIKAFGTATSVVVFTGDLKHVVEQIGSPATSLIQPTNDIHSREIRIQRGDTVGGLLSGMGIDDQDALTFLRNTPDTEPIFRQLAPGKALTARVTSEGNLESLSFPLNGGQDAALLVQRTAVGFTSAIQPLPVETTISQKSAVISTSLFGAAENAGIPDSIAAQLADIFGGDIDFHRDLRKGDTFSVIYEKVTHSGKHIRTQRILAAEFINNGKAYHAYWYQGIADNNGGYYTADGKSVKKAFLRSPLEFSRISSGFSSARYHPVLRETRAHRGIDYAAPTGTRVKATGDGVVDVAGTQGGYGKVVMIRHPGDKITVYGHLSGFAPGIRKGTRVAQGDLIGFVGMTGLATGPHLHYEFRVAGVHRNPLTIALPSGAPISPAQRHAFAAHVEGLMSQITTIRDMQLVRLD
jgi:murein DD-endopeptidase MepM/ murein hydrolase activator NlpD